MKNTRRRSFFLYILILGFLFGLGIFSFKLFINASTWTLEPINRHISGSGLSSCGKITDCNNIILAQSSDNKRKYNADEKIRKAMLHSVGDNSSHITTSVQNLYRSELYGYNFITGINCPSYLSFRSNIKLTLNSTVCKVALEKLGTNKGAVAVYNYKTGDIICMVSTPTYDPSNPPAFKGEPSNEYDGVYLNRVLSSSYTPGSTFKLITSACAIDNNPDIDNKHFKCDKSFKINGTDITCLSTHGDIGFKNALMKSCNIYFAKTAIELGKDKMTSTANSLGFNRTFNINKAQTKMSKYDVTSANDYYLGWSGVGQYTDLINPMHMLILMGAIANNGTAVTPNMVDSVTSENAFSFLTNSYKKVENIKLMKKDTAEKLKEMMRYTVKNNYGENLFQGLEVCAKTGTAEVGEGLQPHAWMVGFSANEKTPFAFVVITENTGSGLKSAAPIAKAVMANACNNTD